MKSEVVIRSRPSSYPKLMMGKSTGMIVLFESAGKGVVLHRGSSGHSLGVSSCGWAMDQFEDFNGVVTVSND